MIDAEMVALVPVRAGRVPAGGDEAVAEAGGNALVVGGDPLAAIPALPSAATVWWAEAGPGIARLARAVAPLLDAAALVVLPGSPDGRDIAPRLAATMGRHLLAGAARCWVADGCAGADLLRMDGRVVVPVAAPGPAVATLWPGVRWSEPAPSPPTVTRVQLAPDPGGAAADPAVTALVEPDPATMDLAESRRVFAGGAGLVRAGAGDAAARAAFALLADVAAALGASAGATRVVTDAGWVRYDRQIGTTGVAVNPDLYVAFGVSGAAQHVGGIGSPAHSVSVNIDASCPMTAISELGLVTDAPSLLVELAGRLGVAIPAELEAWAQGAAGGGLGIGLDTAAGAVP